MSNKGGRVSPDYLADIAPEYAQITGYTYGRYSPENMTAVLEGLRINIQNIEVTFIEAHRDGNTLFLVWKIEDSAYQFTTTLQRKSSYN